MAETKQTMLDEVAGFFSGKIARFGQTAAGVDWRDEHEQTLRFDQLLKVVDTDETFSIADIGCGYAALRDYMKPRFPAFRYVGVDISADMIDAARARLAKETDVDFVVGTDAGDSVDYSVASGTFNMRLGHSDEAWLACIIETLDGMNRCSTRGFAFNCLTSYSDREKMRDDLYYADPLRLFDHCKRNYSRQVALLHDYGRYEFTMIVRKQA